MKQLSLFSKAILSLGLFGVVITLMAAMLLVPALTQLTTPFKASIDRMHVLDVLENEITYDLSDRQLYEAYKIFSLKYQKPEDSDYNAKMAAIDDKISATIQALNDEGAFDGGKDYTSDATAELAHFSELLAAHRQTFASAVSAYQNNDQGQIDGLVNQMQSENDQLGEALRDLVVVVEQDRQDAMRDFPPVIIQCIIAAASGLTLTLLLALLGYILLSAYTRPLGSLRNAICAIAGYQYRPDLLGGLLKKGSSAGRLARALNGLAEELRQRSAGLEQEIADLHQQVHESRKRRLKIYTEEERMSSQ